LPTAGPSRQAIVEAFKSKIINIDERTARQMNAHARAEHLRHDEENIERLRQSFRHSSSSIQRGDHVNVKIANFTPDTSVASNEERVLEGFTSKDIGEYTVDEDGNIDLPYAGKIYLSGKSIPSAREKIQNTYTKSGLFIRPYVTINVQSNGRNGIIVAGDVKNPKILSWQPGGIDLATALTLTDTGENSEAHKTFETQAYIDVIRGNNAFEIPYNRALREQIALNPGDKLIVEKKPAVRATIVGGGILQNGTYNFQQTPSLMEVIAKAGGLNPNNADITNIFIFRRDRGDINVMRINFHDGSGLTTASILPIRENDVIYAPEARVVPWLRVMNIAFQMALPAAVIK